MSDIPKDAMPLVEWLRRASIPNVVVIYTRGRWRDNPQDTRNIRLIEQLHKEIPDRFKKENVILEEWLYKQTDPIATLNAIWPEDSK